MVVTSSRMSSEEYFVVTDGVRGTQLIDGEIVVNEPTPKHQRVLLFLSIELSLWTRGGAGRGEAGLPIDVRLADDQVFAPDIWWVPDERRPARDARRMEGPPALAVEVRSPSTWRYDIGRKKTVYEENGLAELWLVDTAADTVLVFRRSSPTSASFDVALELTGGTDLTSPLLPGFSVAIGDVFDR